MFEIQLCEFMEDIMKFDQDILRGRFFFETENYLYIVNCCIIYFLMLLSSYVSIERNRWQVS